MTKSVKLLSNIAVIVIAAIISTLLLFVKQELSAFYPIINGVLLAVSVFIMALALTKDSSLPDILQSDSENDKGILSKIPFVRLIISLTVYVVFEVCALTLPDLFTLAMEGGDITAVMLLLAAYQTVKWYAVFFILSFKAERPINKIGMIIAFILPFIIVLTENALILHNIHIAINNGNGILSYLNALAGDRYSQNTVISTLLQLCFTAAMPTAYVLIGSLMRKKEN